ncbi:MAG: rhomboid family rane protein [Chitinophagaceae bacterium]|nr:rhomboid family rane protein [Chitinophagaceae bacterium]
MNLRITPAVKNLLFINFGVYVLAIFIYYQYQININDYLGLHSFFSKSFQAYQFVTYMFMHEFVRDGQLVFGHVFFNMLALFFLGPILENRWGSKRFIFFYLFTGLGAGLSYWAVNAYEVYQLREAVSYYIDHPSPSGFAKLVTSYSRDLYRYWLNTEQIVEFFDENPQNIEAIAWTKTKALEIYEASTWFSMVGASGCVYGVLMGAGLLFPNTEVMLFFIPIPIKIKYLAIGLGVMELYHQIKDAPDDNVAHFAHLAGMVFAYILIRYWNRRRDVFY